MEGKSDSLGPQPEKESQSSEDLFKETREAIVKKYDALKGDLKEQYPEIEGEVQEYLALLIKDTTTHSPEDKERFETLNASLTEQGEEDKRIKNFVEIGSQKVSFETIEEEREKGEDEEPEENKDEVKEDEDILPEEAEAFTTKMKNVMPKLEKLAGKSDVSPEDMDDLRREIGDIGNPELLEKIKKAQGPLAKTLYGLWASFLILTALYFLGMKYVLRPFAGKS